REKMLHGFLSREEVDLLVQEDAKARIVGRHAARVHRIPQRHVKLFQVWGGVFTEDPGASASAESYGLPVHVYRRDARVEHAVLDGASIVDGELGVVADLRVDRFRADRPRHARPWRWG